MRASTRPGARADDRSTVRFTGANIVGPMSYSTTTLPSLRWLLAVPLTAKPSGRIVPLADVFEQMPISPVLDLGPAVGADGEDRGFVEASPVGLVGNALLELGIVERKLADIGGEVSRHRRRLDPDPREFEPVGALRHLGRVLEQAAGAVRKPEL